MKIKNPRFKKLYKRRKQRCKELKGYKHPSLVRERENLKAWLKEWKSYL